MGIYLRNNRYYYKKQINGKVYYRALKIRRGQERLLSRILEKIEEEIICEHFGLPKPKESIMLSEYINIYLQKKSYKKSIAHDRSRLNKILQIISDKPLNAISQQDLLNLENTLLKCGYKYATINRFFEVLRHLFNLAKKDGYVEHNPCDYFEKYVEDGERYQLSPEELNRVLDEARKIQDASPPGTVEGCIYDMIVFDLLVGLRLSELLSLQRRQIQDGIIYLPLAQTKSKRKGQKPSIKLIPLSPLAQEIVDRQPPGEYVFNFKQRRHKSSIYRVTKKIQEKTGIPFQFHQLRHICCSLVASVANLEVAKILLGHADIRTTLKYTHPLREQYINAVQALEQNLRTRFNIR